VLLPSFFLSVGQTLNVRLMATEDIGWLLLFLLLAFVSKALLMPILHWVLGLSWRASAFATVLAGCRGFNVILIANLAVSWGSLDRRCSRPVSCWR
jgi:Kef-type K+ transport system membrane component KefB